MIEISLSNVPHKSPGYYVTRNHYHLHIFTLSLYLFGYKLDITRLDRIGKIRFYRYHNLT